MISSPHILLLTATISLAWGCGERERPASTGASTDVEAKQDAKASADSPRALRDAVLARAKTYAEHGWTMEAANASADCSSSYASDYEPGQHVGVPYAWGGYDTPEDLDKRLEEGLGAGSHGWHGVLSCVTGIDCSGFVSRVWQLDRKHSTSTMSEVSEEITLEALQPGDALNKAGRHVVLFAGRSEAGEPILYEASGGRSKVTLSTPGWSYLDGYVAIRSTKLPPMEETPEAEAEPTEETLSFVGELSQPATRVVLRYGEEVGLLRGGEDAQALGPDLLAARSDGTAALYDPERRSVVVVPRQGAPRAFEVGHADGLGWIPGDNLVVHDSSKVEMRVYSEAGERMHTLPLPKELMDGALVMEGSKVYKISHDGERRWVASYSDGKLIPPTGTAPTLGARGRVLSVGDERVAISGATEASVRLQGTWTIIEMARSGARGIEVQRVARRPGATLYLPKPEGAPYQPVSSVADADAKTLVLLHPTAEGVELQWYE